MPDFARWPWQRCRGSYARSGYERRCDLRRGHDGPHLAEGGMDDLTWNESEVVRSWRDEVNQ